MKPHRQRLFATFFGLALVLVVAVGIVLATSSVATPKGGPRDDRNDNQTPIHLEGTLLASGAAAWSSPIHAYWDAANVSQHDSAHDMTINAYTLDRLGNLTVDTEVPLYDENVVPVRPGT